MKLNIVQIGNSKGVRIPKSILNQCNIENEIDLEVENGKIIMYPINNEPRKNWDKMFKQMHENQDDAMLIDDKIDLDMDNWEW